MLERAASKVVHFTAFWPSRPRHLLKPPPHDPLELLAAPPEATAATADTDAVLSSRHDHGKNSSGGADPAALPMVMTRDQPDAKPRPADDEIPAAGGCCGLFSQKSNSKVVPT